jgi:TPR repeat protein
MKRIFLTALAALLLCNSATWAGPYEDGVAAYKRGDYANALRLIRPLAEQGNAVGQLILGAMYTEGQGVKQDYVEAIKWFRLGAAQGLAIA